MNGNIKQASETGHEEGVSIVKTRIRNAVYFILGILGLGSTPAIACVETYLCVDGVEGESQSDLHPNCIDVLAWSWGMTQSGSMHIGGGGGSGQVSVQDVAVTKYIDKSTPDLMLMTAEGKHVPKVGLINYRCGAEGPTPYFELVMEEVIVSSISTGGSGGEARLTENVTLNFAKVGWCYTSQDSKGGVGTETCFGWDIQQNIKQ